MRQEELITMPALVRLYLNYLSAIKSKSMLTVLEYGSDLRLFFRFISILLNRRKRLMVYYFGRTTVNDVPLPTSLV